MAETEQKKGLGKKLGIIIGAALLAVLLVAFGIIFAVGRLKPVSGSKSITIDVTGKEKATVHYSLKTDAEYLRQAMEEADGLTFDGTESEYGMMVETVNGETADYNADGAYWAFYVNGDYANYGIDTQPVYDGDAFKIEYTVYTE